MEDTEISHIASYQYTWTGSPIINIWHQHGTFVTIDGSTFTRHCHPESIVHYGSLLWFTLGAVHSEFGQVCNDVYILW
jgi:hypothetical protein